MKKRKVNTSFYMPSADKDDHIYLKKERVLTDLTHFHNSVEFLFIVKGSVKVFINGKQMLVPEGGIFYASSYEPHSYEIVQSDTETICIVLGKDYITSFELRYAKHTFPKVMADAQKNAQAFEIASAWEQRGSENWFVNHALANLLFATLIKNYQVSPCIEDKKNVVILNFLLYINDNYVNDISLKSMAKHFGYSPEYCSSMFNKYVGKSFRAYLNDLRMSTALGFIKSKNITKVSMDEIIYRSGFTSTATFYRCYSKLVNKPEDLKI